MAEKKKRHRFASTKIEHHADGSHTIHHQHEEDPSRDSKHAVADLDAVHDSLQDHLNAETDGDKELDGGTHGIPAEHAGPAGLPIQTPVEGSSQKV